MSSRRRRLRESRNTPRPVQSGGVEPQRTELQRIEPQRIGATIGGYTIVRKLGESERAEVYLGHAGSERAAGADGTAAESVRTAAINTAAIKVYRPDVATTDIELEIEAISRAAHPHVVALRDLATVDTGQPCLVLERLARGSLASLLVERPTLRAGEVVTMLAPIVAAVDVLHESGVVHGRIRASSVLFRSSGAPVLAGFGRASVRVERRRPGVRTAAELAADAGVLDDRECLATLVGRVLDTLPVVPASAARGHATAIIEWLDAERGKGFPDALGAPLAERLFALADPEPIRFGSDVGGAGIPTRIQAERSRPQVEHHGPDADAEPESGALDAGKPPSTVGLPTWIVALHLPEWIDTVIDSILQHLAAGHVRRHLATVRTRYWVSAAVVLAGLVVAGVLVPGAEQPEDAGPAPGSTAAEPPSTAPTPVALGAGPVAGDDPVAALEVLLEARNRCVAELSVLCLDDVLQRDSAAMELDVALIRSLQAGAEVPGDAVIEAEAIVLVERLGDTALLDLGAVDDGAAHSNPASALVSRGEAGWRIRGYLD